MTFLIKFGNMGDITTGTDAGTMEPDPLSNQSSAVLEASDKVMHRRHSKLQETPSSLRDYFRFRLHHRK